MKNEKISNFFSLAGVLTIPVSLISCVSAASDDFEKWKKMRHLREKGMPVKLMPYPYKFDWTDYEIKLRQKGIEKKSTIYVEKQK